MCVCSSIEEAFDVGYLCFLPNLHSQYIVYVLDDDIKSISITDFGNFPWQKPAGTDRKAVTYAMKEYESP